MSTLVHPRSLGETLDAVNELLFRGRKVTKADCRTAARWIAGRQGLPGAYANMMAPVGNERRTGTRVFTGERVRTGAATSHILGEEACRALILMNVNDRDVRRALAAAQAGILARVVGAEASSPKRVGTYCCGICSVAFWRHLSAGGLGDCERRLTAGLKILKQHRLGNGRWRRFPFYYTLLALTEMPVPQALDELRYVAPLCEKILKRRASSDGKYALRQRAVLVSALAS